MLYPGAKDQALFLYGFDITIFNQFVNFQIVSMGPILTATIPTGNYTATQFMAAVVAAMSMADPTNTYTMTIDRTTTAGTSNRMTISTSGSFLSILFGTGPNAFNSIWPLIGFNNADYTGMTSYTGYTNSGVILIPEFPTWDYNGPDNMIEQDGMKNVSATGIKETLVFAQMQFFQGDWRYITDVDSSMQLTQWQAFLKYATKQLQFEFEPSINESPNLFYQCTLESTPADSNGLKYTLEQMTSVGLYRFYQTGKLKFRVVVS